MAAGFVALLIHGCAVALRHDDHGAAAGFGDRCRIALLAADEDPIPIPVEIHLGFLITDDLDVAVVAAVVVPVVVGTVVVAATFVGEGGRGGDGEGDCEGGCCD